MSRRSTALKLTAAAAVAAAVLPGTGATSGPAMAHEDDTTLASFLGSTIDSTLWGDNDSRGSGPAGRRAPGLDAASDLGSMYSLTKAVGAQRAWARGYTGKDVTVAVIDTGIAPVPGLDRDDKVLDGPDLSYDGQSPNTRYLDGYGHGTHMAGIIAGKDDHFDPKQPDPTMFAGVAPDAQLLNMKVGAGDGGVDVTQVIAALDWVVAALRRPGHGRPCRQPRLRHRVAAVLAGRPAGEGGRERLGPRDRGRGGRRQRRPRRPEPADARHRPARDRGRRGRPRRHDIDHRRRGRRLHQRRHLGSPPGPAGARQVGRVPARAQLVRRPDAPRGPAAR